MGGRADSGDGRVNERVRRKGRFWLATEYSHFADVRLEAHPLGKLFLCALIQVALLHRIGDGIFRDIEIRPNILALCMHCTEAEVRAVTDALIANGYLEQRDGGDVYCDAIFDMRYYPRRDADKKAAARIGWASGGDAARPGVPAGGLTEAGAAVKRAFDEARRARYDSSWPWTRKDYGRANDIGRYLSDLIAAWGSPTTPDRIEHAAKYSATRYYADNDPALEGAAHPVSHFARRIAQYVPPKRPEPKPTAPTPAAPAGYCQTAEDVRRAFNDGEE